ncbi:unnamed protein product [Gongylonema pulchrum]|uniref:Uncharacterized protein n=1 Tax=Gongylonema pulchrum TaxID=637853 RepID=A0A3P7QAY6_9BILA|nr:unnamed protein product [Gongylonema pulchrum]
MNQFDTDDRTPRKRSISQSRESQRGEEQYNPEQVGGDDMAPRRSISRSRGILRDENQYSSDQFGTDDLAYRKRSISQSRGNEEQYNPEQVGADDTAPRRSVSRSRGILCDEEQYGRDQFDADDTAPRRSISHSRNSLREEGQYTMNQFDAVELAQRRRSVPQSLGSPRSGDTAECQEHCLNTAFLCDQNHNENNHNEDLEQTRRRRRLYSETMDNEYQFRTSGTTEARHHVNSHEVKSDFFSSQWMPSSNLYEEGGDEGEMNEWMMPGNRGSLHGLVALLLYLFALLLYLWFVFSLFFEEVVF